MESRIAITGRGTRVVDNDTTITTVAIKFNTSDQSLAIERLNSMIKEFKGKLSDKDVIINVREIYSMSADRVKGIFKRASNEVVLCTGISFRYKRDKDIDAIIRSICDKAWDVVVETSISIKTDYTVSKELFNNTQKELYAEAMSDAYNTLDRLMTDIIANTEKMARKRCIVSKVTPLYVQVGGAPILSKGKDNGSSGGPITFSSCEYRGNAVEQYNIEDTESNTRIAVELNVEFEVIFAGS